MKTLLITVLALFASASGSWAADLPVPTPVAKEADASDRWKLTAATDFRYFSWSSARGYPTSTALPNARGSGSEIYIPFAAQLVGRPVDDVKIEILGRGGWVRATQSTEGLSGEVRTTTDTVANATVTYFGFDGFQPFASVAFNFPTGKAALYGTAANARMDPDLVEISSFGEGYNVGPTFGFNVPITGDLIASASVGYTKRGNFTREKSLTPVDPNLQSASVIDPGDVLTFTGSLGAQMGSLTAKITGAVSTETDTRVDGMATFRPGQRLVATGEFAYEWPDKWGTTSLTASFAHAKSNKVLYTDMATLNPIALDTEPFNSNSNAYLVNFQHLFALGVASIGPLATYLHRDQNSYNSATLQFVPAKTRQTVGMLAQIAAHDRVTLSARVERVWTHLADDSFDNKTSLLLIPNSIIPGSGVPAISSNGWQLSGGLNFTF